MEEVLLQALMPGPAGLEEVLQTPTPGPLGLEEVLQTPIPGPVGLEEVLQTPHLVLYPLLLPASGSGSRTLQDCSVA